MDLGVGIIDLDMWGGYNNYVVVVWYTTRLDNQPTGSVGATRAGDVVVV